jgi:hypothetical protein
VWRTAVEQIRGTGVPPRAGGEQRAGHRAEVGRTLRHRGVDNLALPGFSRV